MAKLIKRFLIDEKGATAIEYALIASGIALVIIVSVTNIGAAVKAKFVSLGAAF
ncbi:Flp family type IVb pilin [Bradyrhizobium sp. 2TAF24]|uniref:Flp family type IVb pilin n=1 Tax=Bradyrhizobium sp. 2TAF24 TaxID=3233011 RepID=UPI003F93BAAC